ncbi:hypothetical protein EMCRGX_G009524 [Ephydatia muelleri]
MGLVVRFNVITSSFKDKILIKYPALFRSLGNLGEPYAIKVKRNSKPVSLFAPRRVPIPLHKQVQTELEQMEALSVISKVDIPTPSLFKPNGAIRICVDLKPLNESVLKEVIHFLEWMRFSPSYPDLESSFIPNWPHLESLNVQQERYKNKQKGNYDARHRAHGRADLSDGSEVWVTGGGDGDPVPGQLMRRHLAIPKREECQEAEHQPFPDVDQDVISELPAPAPVAELPAPAPVAELPASAPVRDSTMTRSKTGTRINCPVQYREDK